MTSDEFRAEYRVGQRLTAEGIRTTLAQEARKGRIVLVHELAPASEPEQRRALILLRELAPNEASQVIGTFEVDGETVVVTKFLMGFTSLVGWLEEAVAESSTTVIVTSDNPSTMDMAVHNPNHRRPLTERPVAPALEDTSTQQVLESPAARTPLIVPAQSSPTPSTPTSEAEPTSSFTKLFGEPEPSATPPPAPSAEPISLAPLSRPTPSLGDRAPAPPTPPKSPTADEPKTGDFTRLFGNEPNPPVPASPASPIQQPAVATPMEQPKASPTPAPFILRPAANVLPVDETGPSPITPIADISVPPPPRVRLEALEGAPLPAPASRRDYDSGPRGGQASVPPAPFSALPLIAVPAGRTPAPTPQSDRPDFRPAAAPAPVSPTTPSEGGYTEVLTPARPPLSSAPPRNPTPAVGQAPLAPRTSYTPLIVGLVVFVVLMAVLVVYFVTSSA